MPDSIKLPNSEEVMVVSPTYFDRLADVLEKTPKRTIANYFMWR